jgi:hypothetical protein
MARLLEKVMEQKICVLIFSTTFVWNISHPKKNWARYQKSTCFHMKYSLFLSDFNKIRIFSTDFRKLLKYQISWKSVRWEPCCSMWRTDGQTDKTKLIVACRNFANAPKNMSPVDYELCQCVAQARVSLWPAFPTTICDSCAGNC